MLEALIRPKDHIAARRKGKFKFDVIAVGLPAAEGGSWNEAESRSFQVAQWTNTKPQYAELRAKLEARQAAGEVNPKEGTPYQLNDANGIMIQYSTVSAKFTVDAARLTRINDRTVKEPMLRDADITVSTRPADQRAVI